MDINQATREFLSYPILLLYKFNLAENRVSRNTL